MDHYLKQSSKNKINSVTKKRLLKLSAKKICTRASVLKAINAHNLLVSVRRSPEMLNDLGGNKLHK